MGSTGNINGNAWVADFNKIRKVNVSGEARANTIERCDIVENAYYTNIEVIYNTLLMAFTIPSGGGDEIGTALGTWQEL